jgi:hypothetical protein
MTSTMDSAWTQRVLRFVFLGSVIHLGAICSLPSPMGYGGSTQMVTSPNGITWTLRSTPVLVITTGDRWRTKITRRRWPRRSGTLIPCDVFGGWHFVERCALPRNSCNCVSVVYGNDRFVAVANTSACRLVCRNEFHQRPDVDCRYDAKRWVDPAATYGIRRLLCGTSGVAANSM